MNSKFTELIRKKMPAVVQIYVEGYVGEEVKSILNPRLGDLTEWTGSGFFLDCKHGKNIIVTNAHVVKNAKSIKIMSMLTSQERFNAEVVGIVKELEPDLAVIKLKDGELEKFNQIASSPIPYLKLRRDDNILRGMEVKAIGYPMGMSEPNITGGEITNFISGDRIQSEKYVTNAAINPGNSGGPALDEEGFVVGVNTSIYEDADNIGFITPFSFIKIIIKNIFEHDSLNFADIGGTFQKNSAAVAKEFAMKSPIGIIVTDIEKHGFMDISGFQHEDIILAINGNSIDRHGTLIESQQYHRRNIFDVFKLIPTGQNVDFTVWRDKKEIHITSKTTAFAKKFLQSIPILAERKFLDVWGMTIQILSYEILEAYNMTESQVFYQLMKKHQDHHQRLIVTHIDHNSLAYDQEWPDGEVIQKFNEIIIKDFNHFIDLLNQSKGIVKLTSENGIIGFFDSTKLSRPMQILTPAVFLK